MRIATWNVERPTPKQAVKNEARLEKIREINADIWILTETHEVIDLSATHHGVATAASLRKPRPEEACAAVWSRWPILRHIDTADPTEAVCVELAYPDGLLLVYGSIIPWDGCKGPDGNSPRWEEHYRYIELQEFAFEVRSLRSPLRGSERGERGLITISWRSGLRRP